MTRRYLEEYAQNAMFALDIAERETKHLNYTLSTLFSQTVTVDWLARIAEDEALAEKVDAFASRFGRLQDHLGEKLIPKCAALLGEPQRSLIDQLSFAERMGWINDVDGFIQARKLRNLLVHEYVTEAALFAQALQSARESAEMLISCVESISRELADLGIKDQ